MLVRNKELKDENQQLKDQMKQLFGKRRNIMLLEIETLKSSLKSKKGMMYITHHTINLLIVRYAS